ncbi:glycosyltransferase family 4 protein [Thalassolituus sp. LLYu03]|uniref:glycosyltransferase family 4 protein n=1 Tax=Thalassolituus sp. LLYu03 TaxID=3421656 RepID=UPI003D2B97B4
MKVLIVHNTYQTKGGEDSVVENEHRMLQSGENVEVCIIDNDRISGFFSKVAAALGVVFSFRQFFFWRRKLINGGYDIVHVHNYFPIISPAIFWACKSASVPVVHTLHNFRAICPTAILSVDGNVCEESVRGHSFWAVSKRVYRGSFVGTLFLVFMIEVHKFIGTWRKCVDGYIALTEFSRNKYIEAGWPEDRIYVKPNFVRSLESSSSVRSEQPFALFVGRLSEEKGIRFLVDSFRGSGIKLKVIGDGPEADYVRANSTNGVEYLGLKSPDEVAHYMTQATCLVMASTWYEGFPMVIVEAFRSRLPVVVPRLGNMAAVVDDDVSGLHYEPKNKADLLAKVMTLTASASLYQKLSDGAGSVFSEKYTEAANLDMLLEIYKKCIQAENTRR